MDDRSNPMATAALVCGVGVWILFVLAMCLGFVPFLGVFAFLFVPIEFLVAILGVVTGILGFRQSKVSSVGGGAAIVGLCLSVAWFVIEGVLLLLSFAAVALLLLAGNL